jgi:hypothetical protein
MVCAEERTKFPFDVGHRRIIRYAGRSPSQFDKLRQEITAALRNIERSERAIQQIEEAGVLTEKEGLSGHERTVLAVIGSRFSEQSPGLSDYWVKQGGMRAGITELAVVLGLRKLKQKSFIKSTEHVDDDGDPYSAYTLTEPAWAWMMENESEFVLEIRKPDADSDIPF